MSSQIKNLKSQGAKENIKRLVILFFSLFLTLAVFSQISAAKPQTTSDVVWGGGLNKADWLYYKSNNDLSAYLGKKSSNLPTVRYQKNNDYLEFSMTEMSSNDIGSRLDNASVSLETNTKTPNTPTLFYRNIFDGVDANYQITNLPFRVKEEIVLKNPPAAPERNYGGSAFGGKSTTFLFSAETTGKPVKQKDGSIAFFDNQNNYFFQLDKPFMVDAKLNRSEAVTIEIIPNDKIQISNQSQTNNFKFQNPNTKPNPNFKAQILKLFDSFGFGHLSLIGNLNFDIGHFETELAKQYQITLTASSDWLSAAAYPVIIDPTVTHNADANFTGQMNRIADNDSISSTQLESSYPEATKDPHTVLLLHFNEANGATAGIRDYASTTRVITANGNASTTNYVTQLGMGNSAAFDGTGDYLSAPDDTSLDFVATDNFTIDFWIKHSAIATNPDYAITKADATTGGYKVYMDASGDMCFDIDDDATWTPDDSACTSAIDYDNDAWHHIAGVKTGTTKIELFVDGVLAASDSTLAASGTLANTNGFYVGMDRDGSSNGWDGYIDEARVVGRALTPEEIKAAASRRPYAVYTSPVVDAAASVQWDTLNWTEGGVNTGDRETLYNTNSLVAQWNFNETSGTTATSSTSGSCQTCAGTLNGFADTSGQDVAAGSGWTANNKKWGAGALMFDGSNDYVSVADNASLEFGSNNFTMETWIKPSVVSINQNIASKYYVSGDGAWFWRIKTNNTVWIAVENDGSGTGYQASFTTKTPLTAGNWYHLAVVRDGGNWYQYLNGIIDGSLATSTFTILDRTADFEIGDIVWSSGTHAQPFNGIIDSFRVYNSRALSASEILSNYNAGNIEIQTRTGATSDPNDGTWEAWKPTTGETQLFSLDSDAVNWHSDIMASTTIATSTETVIKAEGTGSLKIRTGMASTTAGTVALWHFEETGTTTGTYLYDETANNNDATTTGTTVVDGIFGKARKFNGTSDVLSALALTGGTAVQSVDFWVYPLTTTEYFVDLNGSAYVWANAGTVTATGFTSPTIYVNGAVSSVVAAGQWQHIAVTTGTGINALVPKIGKTTTNFLEGTIDEVRILNRVLSADEIAETYRMGANHHLTRQVSATDLSAQTKLAFNVAADRPGTYLEAMIGESDYANYELASSTLALSTTTVLYIKGDEIASSTSIKDSSFSGKAITANGNARTSGNGKIGNSVYFDGTEDSLSLADNDDWTWGANYSIDLWFYATTLITGDVIPLFDQRTDGSNFWSAYAMCSVCGESGKLKFRFYQTSERALITSNSIISINTWNHLAIVKLGDNYYMYLNGLLEGSASSATTMNNYTGSLFVGGCNNICGNAEFPGYFDEVRVLNGTALSADQIRQAYEYGLRTHPITIDFGATLQSSDLISSATDYNFTLTATTSGLSATTSGLYLGDKIIIKENLGGTEYTAQGTVNAINTTTGAITVPSWDTGSTFPSGNGYSPNATVFKWQREYFDLTGSLSTHRDAITNLTLRPTNGAEGKTIYLDDFRYNTNYLTASSSSAITSSNGRYLQYRAIFSSTDTFVSPFLTAFNTLYTALAQMFPPAIGVSGGGFLSF